MLNKFKIVMNFIRKIHFSNNRSHLHFIGPH